MPYVITTSEPYGIGHNGPPPMVVSSRQAIATLEEARDACLHTTRERRDEDGSRDAWDAVYSFLAGIETYVRPEGGTVGPLPDGTLIEVEQVSWDELATLSPKGSAQGTTDLLAAYNAQHAPALNH